MRSHFWKKLWRCDFAERFKAGGLIWSVAQWITHVFSACYGNFGLSKVLA
jgi:hypothetical protein